VSTTDKYRVEEPRYLWYCGTKKYRKGDGTGTVGKWYRRAAVVPWYRATLTCWFRLRAFSGVLANKTGGAMLPSLDGHSRLPIFTTLLLLVGYY